MIRKLPETLITLIMRLGGKISNFTKNSKIELNAKSQTIDLKGCFKTSRVLFWFLSKKLLRKQKLLKTAKSLFSGAKWKNLPKSGHISLYSEDYWSKNHFPSACQILYKFYTILTPSLLMFQESHDDLWVYPPLVQDWILSLPLCSTSDTRSNNLPEFPFPPTIMNLFLNSRTICGS